MGTILNRQVQILAYTDDMEIISRRRHEIIHLGYRASSKNTRLITNRSKSKYMIRSRETFGQKDLEFDQEIF